MNDISPIYLAATLARDAGLDTPIGVESIMGGRNNRVFRVVFAAAPPVVLKWYHSDPNDLRDRLRAEWSFLTYASRLGIGNVPQPLAARPDAYTALYSFVPGSRTEIVTPALSRQAAEFAIAINAKTAGEAPLDLASEACFSLADHLATIERRVARLDRLDDQFAPVDEVRKFVTRRLSPAWRALRAEIEHVAAKERIPLNNPVETTVISPSDFGFHNALVDAHGRVAFVDFEYAGRDDPSKLICDYFCQPDRPVPNVLYAEFVALLAAGLQLPDGALWRARILSPAYRIKWICIMLNEFSSVGARRRSFASSREHAHRVAHQLRRAETYLSTLHF
jgi:hypothetical protein